MYAFFITFFIIENDEWYIIFEFWYSLLTYSFIYGENFFNTIGFKNLNNLSNCFTGFLLYSFLYSLELGKIVFLFLKYFERTSLPI